MVTVEPAATAAALAEKRTIVSDPRSSSDRADRPGERHRARGGDDGSGGEEQRGREPESVEEALEESRRGNRGREPVAARRDDRIADTDGEADDRLAGVLLRPQVAELDRGEAPAGGEQQKQGRTRAAGKTTESREDGVHRRSRSVTGRPRDTHPRSYVSLRPRARARR